MNFLITYKKTIITSILVVIVSLIKIPTADDILNLFWVDVVPIHPTIENSFVEITSSISTTPNVDKYEHCIMYAVLAFIMWLEIPKRKKWRPYITILLYGSSLGLLLEFLQAHTSYRSYNNMDAIANTCGITLALILIFIISYFYERKRKNMSDCTDPPQGCWPC